MILTLLCKILLVEKNEVTSRFFSIDGKICLASACFVYVIRRLQVGNTGMRRVIGGNILRH